MLLDEIKIGKTLPEHKDYEQMLRKMQFWEASVEVNEEYYDEKDPNGNLVLKKFTCEDEDDFSFRKSIASPRNYMFGILNKYLSTVFKSPQVRQENDFYSNVDLLGSSISDFFAHKAWEACVYGASYCQPDSTSSDPNLSEAAKRQMGIRPFIRSIETFNVVNWVDYLGHLQEVIVRYEDSEGTPFAIYYNQEDMMRIELSKDKVVALGDLMPHGYSFQPIIRIMPFNTSESFVSPGCLTQMGINNLLSLEKTELFSNTFTRFFLKGVRTNSDDGEMQKVTWGTNRLIVSDSSDAAITPLGADPAQAQSIRDSISGEEDALYRQYHLSASQTKDASQTPSGFSLVISREDFNNICSQISNSIERAEKQLAVLLNETEGIQLDESVSYSKEFIEPSKQEELLALRDILALPVDDQMKQQEIDSFKKKFYPQ